MTGFMMGRKRKNRDNTVDRQNHNSIEDPLTIKSSWFGDQIHWVSRHYGSDETSIFKHSCAYYYYDGSGGHETMPLNNKSYATSASPNNDNDELNISAKCNKTCSGINATYEELPSTHTSLSSELNQLKQQLMPAAQSCADAINNFDNTNNNRKATTPQYEFRQARSICNPYESMGDILIRPHRYNKSKRHNRRNGKSSSFQFVNRSAIKLANIDALLGFALTNSSTTKAKANDEKFFAFVDLCGAPGGFSEYILYRHMNPLRSTVHVVADTQSSAADDDDDDDKINDRSISCFGFGMSLLGKNNEGKGARWDLNHLRKHYNLQSNNELGAKKDSTTTSQPPAGYKSNNKSKQLLHYHVCRGIDGTGTIYNWDNVIELQRQISMHLSGKNNECDESSINASNGTPNEHHRVHLVVADGGFDAQRDSDNQEVLAHHIVVSQTAAALSLLRKGGIYIVKMFGFHEVSTMRMLSYLYGCFDKMTFMKPTSSRPASAERYLICSGYSGVGSEWDGLAWKQQQMDIISEGHPNNYDCTPLANLAAKFDLDVLKLNVESCRSIVDYLNKKRDGLMKEEETSIDC